VSAQPARGAPPQAQPERREEPDEGAAVEVVFSPAEPVLTPGAARAVLDLLLRAYQAAQKAPPPAGAA
jgi:hypothetical protein